MISGFSPSILRSVLSGEEFNPMSIMLDMIMKERYDCIDKVI